MANAHQPADGSLSGHVEELLHSWVYPERKRLTQVVAAGALTPEQVGDELARLTEAAARTLRVERASIWRLGPEGQNIECLDLFERTPARHTRGPVITAAEAPNYFAALLTERSIVAPQARTDPRTSDFTAGYLEPVGIVSMLDVPVFVGGRLVAVVCHEHLGLPRQWQAWEELISGTFADFASLVFEGQARQRASARIPTGEREAVARIRNLEDSEGALRQLMDSTPVPVVLTRAADHRFIYANRRALEMFGESAATLTEKVSSDFWVDPEARRAFLEQVLRVGRVESLDAQLRDQTGRRFWVRMSGEAVRFKGELALLGAMVDIDAQHRAEDALKQSEEGLRTLLDAAPLPLVLTGLADGVIRYCNLRAATMFDLPARLLIGSKAADFYLNLEDCEAFVAALRRDGRVEDLQVRLKTSGGQSFWALLNARALELGGEPVFLVAFAEVTAQKELEQRLWTMATTDGLTGIANRRHFFEQAGAELSRAERYGHSTSLAMLDLDHFKAVNDALGHEAGDRALKNVVAAVRPLLRDSDLFARYGGEEFCVLLPETPLAGAQLTLERIRAAVAERRLETDGDPRQVTVSVGLAEWKKGEPLDALLRRADQALYEAKAAGRDRVVVRA